MRRGIWHKVLNRLERAQVDLTVRVVKKVRSLCLAKVLNMIIDKLSTALQSRFLMAVRSVGFSLALKLSKIAQSWGLGTAEAWALDSRFARFLAIMDINSNHSGSLQR
jgi:hypothetical protein